MRGGVTRNVSKHIIQGSGGDDRTGAPRPCRGDRLSSLSPRPLKDVRCRRIKADGNCPRVASGGNAAARFVVVEPSREALPASELAFRRNQLSVKWYEGSRESIDQT